jgi:chemotaxis protein MotD
MMDAISAPRPPVPDSTVSSSSAGRGEKTEEGGSFSKVLSSSGEQERGTRGQEATTDDQATTDEGGAETSERTSAAKNRPIIDLANTLAGEFGGLPADMSADELSRLLAAAKAQGRTKGSTAEATELQVAEPEVQIDGLDPKLKAELAKALASVREKKTSEQGEQSADASASTEQAEPDGVSPNLVDVLKLLAGEGVASKPDEMSADTEKSGKEDLKLKFGEALAMSANAEQQADSSTSGDEQESQADRDFRFVRADGKGQSLLLRSEAGGGAEQAEQKTVETVTVIDSRRFIAPVSTTNAASITAAMVGDGEWVSAMSPGSELANAAAQSSHGKVVHTLKLQMTPIELGSVTATLRLSGDELSVQLTVDNPAALRQLSNDQSDILKSLRAQGLVVDQIQVNMQVNSTDRSADAGQNTGQGQPSGQQTAQPGSQGGSERQQRGDTTGSGAGTGNDRGLQAAETANTDSGSTRSGQLYI